MCCPRRTLFLALCILSCEVFAVRDSTDESSEELKHAGCCLREFSLDNPEEPTVKATGQLTSCKLVLLDTDSGSKLGEAADTDCQKKIKGSWEYRNLLAKEAEKKEEQTDRETTIAKEKEQAKLSRAQQEEKATKQAAWNAEEKLKVAETVLQDAKKKEEQKAADLTSTESATREEIENQDRLLEEANQARRSKTEDRDALDRLPPPKECEKEALCCCVIGEDGDFNQEGYAVAVDKFVNWKICTKTASYKRANAEQGGMFGSAKRMLSEAKAWGLSEAMKQNDACKRVSKVARGL